MAHTEHRPTRILHSVLALLNCTLSGCATTHSTPAPRYVWYCHIAGGASCTGELIRCWDRQRVNWVDDAHCAAIKKPEGLVHNQSYPPLSIRALFPGR